MTCKNPLVALIGCSIAFASAVCAADDTVAVAAEKSEHPATTTTTTTIGAAPAAPLAAILTWPATLEPVKKAKAKGVPNFGKLNDHIWRSGQPTKEGYASLKELGVKTIVNLRKEAPGDK